MHRFIFSESSVSNVCSQVQCRNTRRPFIHPVIKHEQSVTLIWRCIRQHSFGKKVQACKMLGTSSPSPTSSRRQSPRRSRYDVDFMVMRLIIFSIADASADHITDCVLQMTSAAERQSLLEEYRQCKMQQGRCESGCDLGPTASPTRVSVSGRASRC
jgi:hypothetical protein